MAKRQAPASGNVGLDPVRSDTEASKDASAMVDDSDHSASDFRATFPQATASKSRIATSSSKPAFSKSSTKKKIIMVIFGCVLALVIFESSFVQADFIDTFLEWVEKNPVLGLGAILVVIAGAVVTLLPIGTPLTIACGYIYRGVYGWRAGLFISTLASMAGSTLGAVASFLLGRYFMRDTVKLWVRNYPLFDAIDVAASQHGLKIMAMLYLTPVLPLGLVSYACGTTSMNVGSFALAKVASLPLYLLYTFIGASAHSFIKRDSDQSGSIGQSMSEEAKKLEENRSVLVAGLMLSIAMMTLITRHIRKELMKVGVNAISALDRISNHWNSLFPHVYGRYLINKRRK
jgi:uncharacterized membrane protein YdjX (TVP38/TMEM64 family)